MNYKEITYKLKFIDSGKFTPDSLSDLVDNIAKEIYSNKSKECVDSCFTSMEENCKTNNTNQKCY